MMTQPASVGCPFCEKKGLPILPLRYAVVRTDYEKKNAAWKGLDLPSGLGAGITDISLPSDFAKYTGRLLRPGYLYVFNEVRGEWKAYLVTELGYLYEFDIEITTPPDADEIEFSCFRTGEEYIARCITIPDAANAGRVWLGFSDTAWTADVLKKHRRQEYREKHMRVVDVKQWVEGNRNQPHAIEASKLEVTINEFVKAGADRGQQTSTPHLKYERDPDTGEIRPVTELATAEVWAYPPFGFSPHSFNGFKHEAAGLLAWAEQVAGDVGAPAMLVALDDPAGITMELAGLMGRRLDEFMQKEHLQRPLAISALVDSLGEAIRNNAELDCIKQAEQKAINDLHVWNTPLWDPRIPAHTFRSDHERKLKTDPVYRREWEEKTAAARQSAADALTEDALEQVAEKAWKKYRNKLQPGEPDHWRETTYQPELEDYDQKVLVPLARIHQAWLKSDATKAYFECNHDDADGDSGAGYVQALLLCVGDTQQNKICFDQYVEWLSANTADHDNLLQRALLHNQEEVIEALSKAVPGRGLPQESLPSIKWRSLISLYQRSLKHVNTGGKNSVAQLMVAVGGPIMKVVDGMVDNTVGRLVVAMGLIGQTPILRLTHAGTVDQALDVMVAMMKQVNPEALGNVDAGLLKRRLQIRSRGKRKTIQGRGAGGRFKAGQVTLRMNRFALGQLDGTGSPADIADRAALTVLRMDEFPKNGMARFRAMFGTNARLAVVGLILQVVDAKRMAGKLDETMEHRRVESNWRFRSSVAAIVGGIGSLLHEGIENGMKAGSVRLAKAASSMWNKALGVLGKGLGVVAAGILAVFDGINAYKQAVKGNVGMAALYFTSAIAGLGAAVLFTAWGASLLGLTVAAATGIGIILVVVGIAIAVLIEIFKTNELQDWMERCLFGSLDEGERYRTFEQEMGQFGVAMRALGVESEDESEDVSSQVLAPQAG